MLIMKTFLPVHVECVYKNIIYKQYVYYYQIRCNFWFFIYRNPILWHKYEESPYFIYTYNKAQTYFLYKTLEKRRRKNHCSNRWWRLDPAQERFVVWAQRKVANKNILFLVHITHINWISTSVLNLNIFIFWHYYLTFSN